MSLVARKYLQAILGITLIGVGVACNYTANLGLGPWGVFHDGISKTIGVTYGQAGILTSLITLFLWIPLKQKPGIGTILNAIFISVVIDLSLFILPYPEELLFQLLQVFIGIFIIGIGSGYYLAANLGPGPRDGLMTGLQRITKFPIAWVRASIEISVVILGWILGGTVGIGTLIFAFGIGPAVALGLYLINEISLKPEK